MLGSRALEKQPANAHALPPSWHVRSTSSLPLAKSTLEDPKEKLVEAACKKLWTAVHGSENLIQSAVAALRKEGHPTNQAFLQALNKCNGSFPGMLPLGFLKQYFNNVFSLPSRGVGYESCFPGDLYRSEESH